MVRKRLCRAVRYLYFLGELTDPKMKDYIGINDENDLFVNTEAFDYNKFRPVKNYRDDLLEKIAQNEYIRPHEHVLQTALRKRCSLFSSPICDWAGELPSVTGVQIE